MDDRQDYTIIKSSGEKVKFSFQKLKNSLIRSGADEHTVEYILNTVSGELYEGIFASKYKLKKAIYELGPTAFPFEQFIAAILQYPGFESIEVDKIKQGKCVSHEELDVVAKKGEHYVVTECKFHR